MTQWPQPQRGPMPGGPMPGPWSPPASQPTHGHMAGPWGPVPPHGRAPYPPPPHQAWQGFPPPQPPKRPRGALTVLLAVIVVLGLFVTVAIAGMGRLIEVVSGPQGPVPQPTGSEGPGPNPPEPEPEPPPTTPSYENDDYRVPPPNPTPGKGPKPATYGEADDYLQRNKLYNQQTPLPVRCRPDGIDATRTSVAERGAYYTTMTECLMRVWAPLIGKAGFTMHRPTVTMYTAPIRTACGTMDELVNGFYCSGDGQIYIGSRDYEGVLPSQQSHRQNVDFTLAHEFGHAIQDRTGILASGTAYENRHKGTALENTYSRRLEQQADCLSGLFTNSVAQARGITEDEKRFLGELVRNFGGRRGGTHGTPESRQKWLLTGTRTTSLSVCNTYIVPESEVE